MKKTCLRILILLLINFSSVANEFRGIQIQNKELGSEIVIGKQCFAFIAIDQYQHWLPLQKPVKDALELKNILVKRYLVDKVYELYNSSASKENIIKLFEKFQYELKPEDSLFIFYAGHGYYNDLTSTGFWIPVDADADENSQTNWLPNPLIRKLIANIKAKHIFLISDSCYSGDMLSLDRGYQPVIDDIYFKKAYEKTSRQIMTSGNLEQVPDDSVFANCVKSELKNNTNPYLDPLELFSRIRLNIYTTTPVIGSINGTGHQDGAEFILFLKYPDVQNKLLAEIPDINPVSIPGKTANSYFNSRFFTGIDLLLSADSRILNPGISFLANPAYSIPAGPLHYAIGLNSGITFYQTRSQWQPGFNLLLIPLEAHLKLALSEPMIIDLGVGGGLVFCIQNYFDQQLNHPDYHFWFNIRPSVSAFLSIGYRISDYFSLSAFCSSRIVFFNGSLFTGITPGLSVQFSPEIP